MIKYKGSTDSFSQLLKTIGDKFLTNLCADRLDEGLSNKVKYKLIEFPYVDRDFRSVYYSDLSKRHKQISRDCVRVHLFETEFSDHDLPKAGYLGFITLRQTPKYTIGRSYLSPRAVKHSPGYVVLSPYKVNILGQELSVNAFPWMQQDINVTVCAHVAAWSVMRYFSSRQPWYTDRNLAEVVSASLSPVRKIPSEGLTMGQMAHILNEIGFSTKIFPKTEVSKDLFPQIVYHYVESGIPVIANIAKEHAMVIIGHGLVKKTTGLNSPGITDASSLIDCFLSSDDNYLPYRDLTSDSGSGYSIDQIEGILVPLHDKMYITPVDLLELLLPQIEKQSPIKGKKLIRRVFLTSSRALKKYAREKTTDTAYKAYIYKLNLPKFVWIVEYSEPKHYDDRKADYRLIVDSTATIHDKDAILSFQQGSTILDYSNKKVEEYKITDPVTPLIINNLTEI